MRPQSHRAAAIKQKSLLSSWEPLGAHLGSTPRPRPTGTDCFLMRLRSQGLQEALTQPHRAPTSPVGHQS